MFIMKYISITILMVLMITRAWAAEYQLIVPNPPGSSSDVVARVIAEEYNRISGNTLILEYAVGGDHIIAVNKFRSLPKPAVILGSTTMHVFNYVYKDSLPYSDQDFDHVGWIGWSPHVWYTRSNTAYKTLADVNLALKGKNKINIGVDSLSTEANVISVAKHHPQGSMVEIIKYKGSPEVLMNVLSGTIDIAVASLSELILNTAQSGKIRILATSNDRSISLSGNTVPAANSTLGVNQFNGGFLISVSAGYSDDLKIQQLKVDLLKAINSQLVKERLSKIYVEVDGRGTEFTKSNLVNYREKLNRMK
jgi:tripartite-type tricarboxylate transporter receptor subunit TctC